MDVSEPTAEEVAKLSGMGQVPIGTIVAFGANAIPQGWLLCNGAPIDRRTYANLFKVIGTTFGGSGNTFNLPDLASRFPLGDGHGAGLSKREIGKKGGVESVTLTVAQIPPHNHVMIAHRDGGGYGGCDEGGGQERVSTLDTGGGQPHENVPPFLVLRFVIKY